MIVVSQVHEYFTDEFVTFLSNYRIEKTFEPGNGNGQNNQIKEKLCF